MCWSTVNPFLIALCSVTWAQIACAVSTADLPTMVVYIADDLGRLETSVYGSTEVKTPTLERLSAAGMTFDNAYVASPSCCPNRFSLLTGLMPARHGAHPNHSQPKPGTKYLLPQLKAAGYEIASFGKVAHGKEDMDGVDFRSLPPKDLLAHVKEFLAQRTSKSPLCLLVGDRRPHVAWTKEMAYDPHKLTLPEHFIDTPETRQHWSRYLTDITGMDHEMGQVQELVRKQLGDDCLFLFTSDHGGQWPLGKWNLYDSGTRIPLIVAWPGHIAAGKRADAMVSWVDLLPTLLDIAGAKASDDIDGRSFADVLVGKANAHREQIFTTHTGDGNRNIFPIRSIRRDDWKLIFNLRPDAYHTNHSDLDRKDGAGAYWDSWDEAAKSDPIAAAKLKAYYTRPPMELFNLATDPHERHNLALDPEYQRQLAALKNELMEWTQTQGDDMQPHREPYLNTEPLPLVK